MIITLSQILIAMALVALPVLLRAVWGDRSRGRPRCPRCWYAMRDAPSRTCPECGHTCRRDRDLHRTRRRWWVIGISATPVIAAFVLIIDEEDIDELIPTSALLAALHITDNDWCWPPFQDRTHAGWSYHADFDYLFDPISHWQPATDRMWSWQWSWLERIAVHRINVAQDPTREQRWGIVITKLLERSTDPVAQARLRAALKRYLDHPDPRLRRNFAYWAIDPYSEDEFFALTDRFLDEASSNGEQLTAALAVGGRLRESSLTDEQFTRYATEFDRILRHPNPSVRSAAAAYVRSIARSHPPNRIARIHAPLQALRDDPDESVRRTWLQATVATSADEDVKRMEIHQELAHTNRTRQASALAAAKVAQITSDDLIRVALQLLDETSSDRENVGTTYDAESFVMAQLTRDLLPHYEELSAILERRSKSLQMLCRNLNDRPEWRALDQAVRSMSDDPPNDD